MIKQKVIIARIKVREYLNPYLGPIRRRLAGIGGGKKSSFTIISNNCWGGHVYRYFNLPYASPTIGLYFFTDEYIRFLKNLQYYLQVDLKFISLEKSKYRDVLEKRNYPCPIGLLDDVEVVFLHYTSENEAYEKWTRRKARVNFNNLIVKMSEQNLCSIENLKEFDSLNFERKFVFTHKDYCLNSQIVCEEFEKFGEVTNDTDEFRRHVNLIKLVGGTHSYFKK